MFVFHCCFFCRERVTRQLYYQQLKDNLLNYSQEVSEEKCFLLASYSLQADIGNYSEEKHDSKYFDPREYFPAWVIILIYLVVL